MRPPKGTPTDLNVWVLSQVFGDKDRVPNQLEAPDVTHMRRCLRAGLCDVSGKDLVLTPAGRARIKESKKS